MKIKVNYTMDKSYYLEQYSEWLKFRSVYRKWQDKIGGVSVSIAVLGLLFVPGLAHISIGLLGFGGLMLIDYYVTKNKWMSARMSSKMTGHSVALLFENDQIQTFGPFSESKIEWRFFQRAIKTDKGLFIIPENGMSIYIPKKSFANPLEMDTIAQKINNS